MAQFASDKQKNEVEEGGLLEQVVKVYRSIEEYHVCMFPFVCRTNDPETTARMLIEALEDASDESDLKKH